MSPGVGDKRAPNEKKTPRQTEHQPWWKPSFRFLIRGWKGNN